MIVRRIGRALAGAAVVFAAVACGVEAQSEPVRLDSATSTQPVPTVTQRPDPDDPCPTSSAVPEATVPSTPPAC